MKSTSKVIVTIVALVVFFFIFSAIVGVSSEAGHGGPGILGLAMFAALVGVLKSVWKKNPDESQDEKAENK